MALETFLIPTVKEAAAKIKIALIWPGDYKTGMSSLGFLSIYALLNKRPDAQAERFFYPDSFLQKEYARQDVPLLSLETARPLSEFDLVAASLSLENDYWLFLDMLKRGGLSPFKDKRPDDAPLVIAGGVAIWANPWPLWPFVDLFLTGEGEESWPKLISAWVDFASNSLPKTERQKYLCRMTPGAISLGETAGTPSHQRCSSSLKNTAAAQNSSLYSAVDLVNFPSWPVGAEISPVTPSRLAWPPMPGQLPPCSPILSPKAEFADTKLVEISRGCPYGCRFCLAGFIYRPHRPWPLESILKALGEPLVENEKVGLISPAVADYPDFDELLDILLKQKRRVSLSSLRLTAIDEQLAAKLAAGRVMGAAVAPEGGSARLRAIINKNLTEEQILKGSRLLAEAGLKKIKLYFMIGLPEETEADLRALADLCHNIRQVTSIGKAQPELLVSLANFTPKAHTPFEEAAMSDEASFRRKGKMVEDALKKVSRLTVNLDAPNWAIAQGLLARGGPESARLVWELFQHGGRVKPALKAYGYSPSHSLHLPWPCGQKKPWRLIAPPMGPECLAVEFAASLEAQNSSPCPAKLNCGRCHACGQ